MEDFSKVSTFFVNNQEVLELHPQVNSGNGEAYAQTITNVHNFKEIPAGKLGLSSTENFSFSRSPLSQSLQLIAEESNEHAEVELNFDPIETNIANLAVVIAVMVYLLSDLFSNLLKDRKDRIQSTQASANERSANAAQALEQARFQCENAKTTAASIRQQAFTTAAKATAEVFERTTREQQQAEESFQSQLKQSQESASQLVRKLAIQQASSRALQEIQNVLSDRNSGASLSKRLLDAQISRLGQLNS